MFFPVAFWALAQHPEVPAVAVQGIAYSAAGKPEPSGSNASRYAWRSFQRLNYGWRIPITSLEFKTGNGDEILDVPYANPLNTMRYLMQHDPSVVVGGITDRHERARHLRSFWHAYKDCHPAHPVFTEHSSNLDRVLPVAWHGDEGRGKKRGMTCVVSFESVIGLYTSWHLRKGKQTCIDCSPSQKVRDKFPAAHPETQSWMDEMIRSQFTNMKGHSYLQHWPVFILPGSMYKQYRDLLPSCLETFSSQLRQGFYEGFDVPGHGVFHLALIGGKGDLKWFARIANLTRSFEHLGRTNSLEMCHECNAGTAHMPFEDVSSEIPCWSQTVYASRPWQHTPSMARVPFDSQRPEVQFQRDVFHLCKVGIFRDFIGSAILLLAKLGYHGNQGNLDTKLDRAYRNFKLFCQTTGKTPGLRSFTKRFMNAPNRRSFGWANSKGSDTTIIMHWLKVFCIGCQNDLLDNSHKEILKVMHNTAEVGCNMFRLMHGHGIFLTRSCTMSLWCEIRSFIRGYALLAYRSHHDLSFVGFAIKPKLHLLRHLELELFQKLSDGSLKYFLNPMAFGCEANEDMIGRCCRLSRRCDSRLLCQRVLQSVFLKSDLLYRKWKKHGPERKGRSSVMKKQGGLRTRVKPR